ncbi:MAG: 5'-3' exonuclease H3TH domain-containing protein [Planctomycetota bacterium JB042]
MPTIHLVDASPYLFRAYFSLPDLTGPDGSPVQVVRGFASMLLRFFAEESPTHVGVAFDESLNTSFRNEIYPAYKSSREEPPVELVGQLARCQEVARALGAATFVDSRYEADDLIATLCAPLADAGHSVVVVTADKDLAQLVTDRVTWYDFGKGVRYGPNDVVTKYGVRPERIPDFLGLAGDSVDDIPGVKGIGKKTAALLLAEFDALEDVYADLERVGSLAIRGAKSVARKLADGRDLAFLSRELATVARDAPAAATLDELAWRGADRDEVERLFAALGFVTMKERVPRWRG